ncbi:ABC transporter permease [Actibacterium pelagium]|uniref:Drug:proton antiporter n=1 Tax=Actibacterium pelagium TaxID=2029103 RepID=A0A917AMU6_9RHOB|nr:FtsX-like permease family protein [Actibacterium pelagium]GGE62150.1 drug:proton antiporter [Actibacterium pelagium]
MTLPMSVRLARRELRGGLRGFYVLLVCLALGVAAIAAVGTVRESIARGLQEEGAVLLGGDALLQFTYRQADETERAWMAENALQASEVFDFRSMVVVGEERALTQIKAVDDLYPIYGEVELEPAIPLEQALAGNGAALARVLADRLGLTIGDTFFLGEKEYHLTAVLNRVPDDAGGGFGLGPPTLLKAEALDGSGLLQLGTLFETEYRLSLPDGTDLAALQAEATNLFRDKGVRWRDSRNGAPGLRVFVDRLSSFLVLVGLAGLAVGGIGVAAAVRSYLEAKTEVIATLKTLGAESRTIFWAYLMQIGVLSLFGILLGVALGAMVPIAMAPLIEDQLPLPARVAIYPTPLIEATLYGALTALLFTLWPLARTQEVRAASLFRDAVSPIRAIPHPRLLLAMTVVLALLVGLSAYLSGIPRLAIWAAIGIAGALAALAVVAMVARWLSRRLALLRAVRGRTALRLALGSVGGPGGEAVSVVLSLGLGLSVLAAVGQIDSNLRASIADELPAVAPSYFIVDIQNDQLPGLLDRTTNDPQVSRVETAPMLRGIITRINDIPAREAAGNHWVLEGDRGVTYSAKPTENTVITAGEWWAEDYAGPPQMSFAAEEAAEMGLKLGDMVTVNILGRDITAQITSFREVDFSTAGIGFILSLNPAALAGAPHTHIATVYAEEEAEAPLLRDLAKAYPNVTAIHVRDAITRVSDVLAGLATAITYGALATLVTGGFVLIGAAAAGTRLRTFEAAVLKTIGAVRSQILLSFAYRSALLGLAAGLVAVAVGAVAGWAVMTRVMHVDYSFEPVSALLIVSGGVLATLLAGLAFVWGPMTARPAQVLRAKE